MVLPTPKSFPSHQEHHSQDKQLMRVVAQRYNMIAWHVRNPSFSEQCHGAGAGHGSDRPLCAGFRGRAGKEEDWDWD